MRSHIENIKQNPTHHPITLPIFSFFHPERTFQALIPTKGGWKIVKPFKNESFTVPTLHDALLGNQRDYANHMREKYTYNDFISVDEGDTVVDVGAFVGGFSFGIEDIADRILAVEPVPANAECLRLNLGSNADIAEYAVWEEDGFTTLKLSDRPQGHSIFDNSKYGRTTISGELNVETIRLDSLLEKYNCENVDFLKLEAEGAEPEGLGSLGSIRPEKIAVSCGEERGEENTIEDVIHILSEYGYEIKTDKNTVYGRLET